MTQEQITVSLDAMLENPKAKSFLNHLVRAYMPETNVTKVTETPKGDFKCVLTRAALICDQEIAKATNSEEFQTGMKNAVANGLEEKKAESLKKLIGDKKSGVTGKDTTTFMSTEAYKVFMDWVITKALKGDKHVNWLMGSIRRSTLMARAETIQDSDVQKKVANFKKTESKAASFTLADSSDVLTKLKAAMLASGN